jgi:small subunit ribosomal protein S9
MKPILTTGKRKQAIAKAVLREGKGRIRINHTPLEFYKPEMCQLKIREPLIIAGDHIISKVDIDINASGGGVAGQAEAARLAIARALVEFDSKLEDPFQEYDRQLLVADIRRKEPSKPNSHGAARSKVQKSYR